MESGITVKILPNGRNVQIDMDKKGCLDLIEILNDLLNESNCSIIEYDKETGYGFSSGIITSNSMGIIFSRWDK